ncbi:hypothetical protein MSIMFI_04075 [Mycobacterium simulans]|nr:hypothetical protein MSIMFI_04075 [Mycobacterium simulans]
MPVEWVALAETADCPARAALVVPAASTGSQDLAATQARKAQPATPDSRGREACEYTPMGYMVASTEGRTA